GHQAQLPGARRCARPLGLPLPPALPHGSRHVPRSAGGGMNAMILSSRHPLAIGLVTALSLTAGLAPAWGQETDHASHHPEAKPAPAATPSSPKPVDPHAGHQPTPTDTSSDDHGAMDHGNMDHGTMKHGA